jgi:hypothetical protein
VFDWMNQVARLFGPSIFEASKLKVLFLGVDEKKHPGKLPRTYTLTHSDITSKLTLAISQTINNSQVIQISDTHMPKNDLLIFYWSIFVILLLLFTFYGLLGFEFDVFNLIFKLERKTEKAGDLMG